MLKLECFFDLEKEKNKPNRPTLIFSYVTANKHFFLCLSASQILSAMRPANYDDMAQASHSAAVIFVKKSQPNIGHCRI